MSGAFRSPLVYEPAAREGFYRLTQPLGYSSRIYPPGLTVPIGFETDFGSHPHDERLAWITRRLFGTLKGARWAVIHDYAYRALVPIKLLTRVQADDLMEEALRADNVSAWRRVCFMAAVRFNTWRRARG